MGCYSLDENRNCLEDPDLDKIKRALKQLADNGCKLVVISGGEPFMRDDLKEIVQYATENAKIPYVQNILIMIELVLPLNNTVPVIGYTPMIFVPFWGIVAFYQQLIVNSLTSSTLTYTLICTLINTILIFIIAQFSYKKCLIASKKSGNLGQY